jgi:hypothetical protein
MRRRQIGTGRARVHNPGSWIKQGALPVGVTDPNLAAYLLTMGIPPGPRFVSLVEGDADTVQFHFLPQGPDGLTLKACVDAWNQEARTKDFVETHPDDPRSYAMTSIINYKRIWEYVEKTQPKLCVRRGKSIALISPNTSRESQDIVLSKMGL